MPVAIVSIELRSAKVVDDEEVGLAIGIGIAPRAGKAIAIILHAQPRRLSGFDEGEIAFVMKEAVGRAVARVVVGDRVMILIQSQVVLVCAEIKIETAIAVVVGCCGMGKGALGLLRKAKRIVSEGEGAIVLILIEQRAGAAEDEEILEAAVAEIGEECGCSVVEHADSRLVGDVLEGAVPTIAIEAVRQAGWLADVEIIEAVVVVVARCDTIVAVDINANGAIENGTPVVCSVEKLLCVR